LYKKIHCNLSYVGNKSIRLKFVRGLINWDKRKSQEDLYQTKQFY
jgi:hypothetical protein